MLVLEVTKTHAQINHGWIDTTEQEVVHTIDQPSIHSNLVTQNKGLSDKDAILKLLIRRTHLNKLT